MSSGAGFNGNLPVYNNLHSNHLILNKFKSYVNGFDILLNKIFGQKLISGNVLIFIGEIRHILTL